MTEVSGSLSNIANMTDGTFKFIYNIGSEQRRRNVFCLEEVFYTETWFEVDEEIFMRYECFTNLKNFPASFFGMLTNVRNANENAFFLRTKCRTWV